MNVQSFPLALRVPVPTSHWDGQLAADIFAPEGTPVLAVFDGSADAYTVPAGGNAITLVADDGTAAYYAHLQAPGRSGRVRAGEVIGYEGRTGNADKGNGSSDAHLHLGLATSAGLFAALNGAGDIAPWLALAGIGVPTAPAAPNVPGVAPGVRWGPIVAVAGVVLVALAILDD